MNINDYVEVVLTDRGADIWNTHEMSYEGLYPGWRPNLKAEGDICKRPLWEIMQVFGPGMHFGCRVPFKECQMTICGEKK